MVAYNITEDEVIELAEYTKDYISESNVINGKKLMKYLAKKKIKLRFFSELFTEEDYRDYRDYFIKTFGKYGVAIIINGINYIFLNDMNIKAKTSSYLSSLSLYKMLFTLMHELGHFLLGHRFDDNSTMLSSSTYNKYEKQANIFASQILLSKEADNDFIIENTDFNVLGYLDSNELEKMASHSNISWDELMIRLDVSDIQDYDFSKFLVETYDYRKLLSEHADCDIDLILEMDRKDLIRQLMQS